MKEFNSFMVNFDKLLRNDENLLRLLYYKSKNFNDDIFQITNDRPSITPPFITGTHNIDPSIPFIDTVKQDSTLSDTLRHTLVYSTIKVSDLTINNVQSCRLLFYLGDRTPSRNYQYPFQDILIDIYVHVEIDKMDYRLAKLCDYITSLIDGKYVGNVGLGTCHFNGGRSISLNDQYIGYRLYFRMSSERS